MESWTLDSCFIWDVFLTFLRSTNTLFRISISSKINQAKWMLTDSKWLIFDSVICFKDLAM